MTPTDNTTYDVVVVGGGVCGLVVAWRAAQHGMRVCVLERGTLGAEASAAAAGMLAPVSEAEAAEPALARLGLESVRRWPAFAAELRETSGLDVGLRDVGTLLLARDRDEAQALDRERALRERLGLEALALPPSRARALEPSLVPSLRAALEIPGDHCVDPRALCAALARAVERAGVGLRTGAAVARVLVEDGRASGVELIGGERVGGAKLVLATGAWSGAIEGLPPEARVPVRPVKGQVIGLRDPRHEASAPLLDRVVRFEGGYIVPRGDGRYVLGASVEERGFDKSVTALAIYELLRDAHELVPGVLELDVVETRAGLRPGTPDNAPILGPSPVLGDLVWATGHHRNGILLSPLTGDLVVEVLAGGQAAGGGGENGIPAAFSPGRFAEVSR